mmetsp:Transcript_23339/g.81346  ORF Transcript_23339/g.81346 Transcript_23339/m.81346 type:complete len:218 (+) Transcript_23339:130-783(+)
MSAIARGWKARVMAASRTPRCALTVVAKTCGGCTMAGQHRPFPTARPQMPPILASPQFITALRGARPQFAAAPAATSLASRPATAPASLPTLPLSAPTHRLPLSVATTCPRRTSAIRSAPTSPTTPTRLRPTGSSGRLTPPTSPWRLWMRRQFAPTPLVSRLRCARRLGPASPRQFAPVAAPVTARASAAAAAATAAPPTRLSPSQRRYRPRKQWRR